MGPPRYPLDPRPSPCHHALAVEILVELGRHEEALERLEPALAVAPAHPAHHLAGFALARALRATGGDADRARKLAEAARERLGELGPDYGPLLERIDAFLGRP